MSDDATKNLRFPYEQVCDLLDTLSNTVFMPYGWGDHPACSEELSSAYMESEVKLKELKSRIFDKTITKKEKDTLIQEWRRTHRTDRHYYVEGRRSAWVIIQEAALKSLGWTDEEWFRECERRFEESDWYKKNVKGV